MNQADRLVAADAANFERHGVDGIHKPVSIHY